MWEFQARLEARYAAFFREDAARPESSETMNINSARVAVLRHALATSSEGTGGDEQAPQFQQDLTYQRSRIQRLLAALREDAELLSKYLGLPPGQESVPVSARAQRSTRFALSFLGDNRTFPAQLFVTIQRHGVEAVLQNEFNLFWERLAINEARFVRAQRRVTEHDLHHATTHRTLVAVDPARPRQNTARSRARNDAMNPWLNHLNQREARRAFVSEQLYQAELEVQRARCQRLRDALRADHDLFQNAIIYELISFRWP
ncbi:hypothetical protein B0A49_08146 [Cryomyces minteri]|uniref:Uncharacterized protein n=1 Tax=Cryomyces minteri TaxID=331657 RepID=A0A4U0X1C1_9PEZI|nr:hypothetical protein B0A49_08146 [Cryomyces minteri]